MWLGVRVEAEAQEPEPDRVAALRAIARELPATTTPARALRALAEAEVAPAPDWAAAIEACRAADDPYLVAHALLRSAQADCASDRRDAAAPALEEAAQLAAALGAAPLLDEARALARRARLPLAEGEAEPPRAGIDALG